MKYTASARSCAEGYDPSTQMNSQQQIWAQRFTQSRRLWLPLTCYNAAAPVIGSLMVDLPARCLDHGKQLIFLLEGGQAPVSESRRCQEAC